jgi:hypothetical protein
MNFVTLKKPWLSLCAQLIEALAFIAVFTLLGISYIGDYVAKQGYDVNYYVLTRMVVFSIVVGFFVIYQWLKKFNVFPINASSILISTLFSTFFIFCSLIIGYVWIATSSLTVRKIILILIAFYVFSYLFKILINLQRFTKYQKIKSKFIFVLVVASLLAPIFTSKYINSESYLDSNLVSHILSHNKQVNYQQKEYFDIELSATDLLTINLNIEHIKTLTNGFDQAYYEVNQLGSPATIRFYFNRRDLTALCLLGDFSKNQGQMGIVQCRYKLKSVLNGRKDRLISATDEIPIQNNSIKKSIYDQINSLSLDNSFIDKSDDVENLARLMFVKGAYFHHYNSIAHTINEASYLSDYFVNQYGFGPLFIASTIAKVSNLPIFDGIYLSIIVVNLLTFLILIFGLGINRKNEIIWLGFAMSILMTYFISNVLAPFVYYVRYFPTVILALLLFNSTVRDVTIKNNRNYIVVLLTCMFFIAFYNFEYAILTFAGVLIAGLLTAETFYIGLGFIFLALSLIPKIILSLESTAASSGANYLAYLSGAGFGSGWGGTVYLFFASVLAVYYIFFKEIQRVKVKTELIVLATIFSLLCVKVIWLGAVNHIGPLFLLLAFLVVGIKHSINDAPDVKSYENVFNIYSSLSLIILLVGIISWPNFYHNNKFVNVEYVRNSLSTFFSIQSGLSSKLIKFKDIYRQGDLVLSPIDNALSLTVKKSVTGRFPDVSTNVNFPIDVFYVTKAYTAIDISRVIVDQDVITTRKRQSIYYNMGKNSDELRDSYMDYLKNMTRLESIYKNLLLAGFVSCVENDAFVVLCRAKQS